MADDGGELTPRTSRRFAKGVRIAVAANIAFAIAVIDILLMLIIFYLLRIGVAENAMGAFALVLFLALATGAALKTWARAVVAQPQYQMFRYPGTWLMAAAYILLVCDIVGIVFVGMILPPSSFLPASFSIDLLLRIASIGAVIAILGLIAMLIQMIWITWRCFRNPVASDEQ